jgi:hypothetical protein
VPWAYIRRDIAAAWGVPPWCVDEAPYDEVLLELRIRAIEGRVAAEQRTRATEPAAPSRRR